MWFLKRKRTTKSKRNEKTSLHICIYTQRMPAFSMNQKLMATNVRAWEKGHGVLYHFKQIVTYTTHLKDQPSLKLSKQHLFETHFNKVNTIHNSVIFIPS